MNQAPTEIKDYYGLPQAAKGATVNEEGDLYVHKKEEVIPAKITSGIGKLGSLLRDALSWRNSDINAPMAVAEEPGPRGVSRQLLEGISMFSSVLKPFPC